MPLTAAGPKSRAHGSKVVPAIPHALASKPKVKHEAIAPRAASPDTVEPDAVRLPPGTEASAEASLSSDGPNAGPEQAQLVSTNGEVITSASTSEKSIATTSQSTPPAPAPRPVYEGESDITKDPQASSLSERDSRHAPATHAIGALPPPFYPASQQSNPSPSTSTSAHPERPAALATMHQRNSSNLVFGGYRDSASPSPGPGMMPFAGPPPGPPFPNHSPGSPVYIPNGHAHHASEPFAGPMYPSPYFPGNGNGNGNSGFGRDYYPGPFVQGRPLMPSGRGPPLRRDFAASPGFPPPRPVPGTLSNAPSGVQQAPDPSPAEMLDLAHYLRSQFGNREYADYVVVISHSNNKLSPGTFALHGLMLARSPKLASLMSMNQSAAVSFPKTLHVVISDRFIDLDDVVTKGLLHLYGDALLDLGSIPGMLAASGFPPNPYLQLRAALAYAALGHFLQMDAIIIRGLDIAASLLKWQSIGLALSFALEGGLGATWSEGVEDKASTLSVDEASSPASAPVYGIYSDRMLHAVIAFIIGNFPADFDLAAGVSQLPEAPRLPTAAEPRHARSGSRLSQIRFGEMTVEDRGPEYTILSGVLLSLPFAILKHVLEQPSLASRLGGARVGQVMRKTIEEREQRRQRIAAQSSIPPAVPESWQDERLWNSVRWEETVESISAAGPESCGLRLSRHEAGGRKEGGGYGEEGTTTMPHIFA